MTTVKIIIRGYLEKISKGVEKASSTTTLIKEDNLNIIVDPGCKKKKELSAALKKENLNFAEVDYVILSHKRLDHCKNVALFTQVRVVENWGFFEGEELTYSLPQISENIEIIKTPGHSDDGISVLVKTEEGVIAVAGDVFLYENTNHDDPYAKDFKTLEKSRKLVLEKADFIIPGHGGMFKCNN